VHETLLKKLWKEEREQCCLTNIVSSM